VRLVPERAALALLSSVAAAMVLAGCDPGSDPPLPAAAAGGACRLINYDTVAAKLGTRFDTAGSALDGETYTCALTAGERAYPDLVFAVTASHADAVIFTATLTPSGATPVTDLGTVGYRIRRGGSAAGGPQCEVGWLSANSRLMLVRFTFPPRTPDEQADALLPRLVDLARALDVTEV
jgi:hypothetical protein